MNKKAFKITWIVLGLLIIALPGFPQTSDLRGQSPGIEVTILATTDVHNFYLDYDYYLDEPTETVSLSRVATAVSQLRAQNRNVLLFDNGDFIQGNPLGEYLARNPPQIGEVGPIMSMMNGMRYDAMSLGNHEFNYGLEYLNRAISGATFPVLSANVLSPITQTPYFRPYAILHRSFRDTNNVPRVVRVGVLGLIPPRILVWDGARLTGRVDVMDAYDAAVKYVAEMKAAGADIVIILSHSGIDATPRVGGEENFSHYLSTIPDVDAIITGHSHNYFPGRSFEQLPGADLTAGTINGVPVVMPGFFADTLGAISLTLSRIDGAWRRVEGSSTLIPIADAAAGSPAFAPDEGVNNLLASTHEQVLNYIRSPVVAEDGTDARLSAPFNSFFALIRDDYSVQLINEAQVWHAKEVLAGTQWEGLPILAAAAPFKAGGRYGPQYYTNVPAGPLAIKNMADIYVYPNTLAILKLRGSEIKDWLERSAGQFNQINPSSREEQQVINDDFRTYNFDVIEGLTYRIDPTQPSRYAVDGSMLNPGAERIRDLQFEGAPIRPDQEFVLVTNNYRAYGGGNFAGAVPANIIYESPDESRQVILKYIESKGILNPQADGNWSLILPTGTGPLVFPSSPDAQGVLPRGISFIRTDQVGFGIYQIQP